MSSQAWLELALAVETHSQACILHGLTNIPSCFQENPILLTCIQALSPLYKIKRFSPRYFKDDNCISNNNFFLTAHVLSLLLLQYIILIIN